MNEGEFPQPIGATSSMIHCVRMDALGQYEDQWHAFMKSVPFGRYLSDTAIDVDKAIEYELAVLAHYMANAGVCYVAVSEDNRLHGLIGFHHSAWDTDVLGKRMSVVKYFLIPEVEMSQDRAICARLIDLFHGWVRENMIDVAVARLDTRYFAPVLTLQEHGYRFFECNTMKTLNLRTEQFMGVPGVPFRYAQATDLDDLRELALKNTFRKSHFYLDPGFDVGRVDALYAKWIDSALRSHQQLVLVECDNDVAGVFIYDIEDQTSVFHRKIGIWKFAAVDSRYRNRGLGLSLFHAAVQSCLDHQLDIIDTSLAEKNIISQKLHDRCGFRLVYTQYTFHKWFQ